MIQWGTVETAIRALTPDEYEALVIRITKTVFDSVKAAGEDITDDQVRKRAAEIALSLINLIILRRMTTNNIQELMSVYNRRGIAVGVVGDNTKTNLDKGMRLISHDLAVALYAPNIEKAV